MIPGQQIYPLGLHTGSGTGSGGLSVALSTDDIYIYTPTAGSTVTTDSVIATPSGGTGPYTYLWRGSTRIVPDTPTAASTTFTAIGSGIANDFQVLARCTVTDNVGAVAFNSVHIEIQIGGEPK
jgi:hypothetical protein